MFQPLEKDDQELLKKMLTRYGSYAVLRQIFVINTGERKKYHDTAVIQGDTDMLGHALSMMPNNQPFIRSTDTIEELVEEAGNHV